MGRFFQLPTVVKRAVRQEEFDVSPGQTVVGPAGEDAKFPVYAAAYWTGRFRFGDRGESCPDIREVFIGRHSPAVNVLKRVDPKTGAVRREMDLEPFFDQQFGRGWIRVDHLIGLKPATRTWDDYRKYADQVLQPEVLKQLLTDGWELNQGISTLRLPADVSANYAISRFDSTQSGERKLKGREIAEANFKAMIGKILAVGADAAKADAEADRVKAAEPDEAELVPRSIVDGFWKEAKDRVEDADRQVSEAKAEAEALRAELAALKAEPKRKPRAKPEAADQQAESAEGGV